MGEAGLDETAMQDDVYEGPELGVVEFSPGDCFDDADIEQVHVFGLEDANGADVVLEDGRFFLIDFFWDVSLWFDAHEQLSDHPAMVVQDAMVFTSLGSISAEDSLADLQEQVG